MVMMREEGRVAECQRYGRYISNDICTFQFYPNINKSIQVDNDWTCIKLNQQGHPFVSIEIVDWFMGSHFHVCKTNNICIARLMMRKQKLNMNFQYTDQTQFDGQQSYLICNIKGQCPSDNPIRLEFFPIIVRVFIYVSSIDKENDRSPISFPIFLLLVYIL